MSDARGKWASDGREGEVREGNKEEEGSGGPSVNRDACEANGQLVGRRCWY
jgi:hypothetical protein